MIDDVMIMFSAMGATILPDNFDVYDISQEKEFIQKCLDFIEGAEIPSIKIYFG